MGEPLIASADCLEDGRIAPDIGGRAFRLACRARFANRRVDVEVRDRKSKRSVRANAALHAGLMGWGQHRGLTGEALTSFVESVKDDLLALCWGYIVRQNVLTGEVIQELVKPHTSRLTVEEFSLLFETGIVEAAKDGYLWELPAEFTVRPARGARATA